MRVKNKQSSPFGRVAPHGDPNPSTEPIVTVSVSMTHLMPLAADQPSPVLVYLMLWNRRGAAFEAATEVKSKEQREQISNKIAYDSA